MGGPERGGRRQSHARPPDADESAHGSRNDPRRKASSLGRVLIVDDEHAIRLVCRVNLSNAGFETLEAEDGPAALAIARSERPDLILLDIMLPAMDGWRVAEELAADPKTREIPIVFLSARSEVADLRRGHEVGGVGYIRKPFDPGSLPELVGRTIDRIERGERERVRGEWLDELSNE